MCFKYTLEVSRAMLHYMCKCNADISLEVCRATLHYTCKCNADILDHLSQQICQIGVEAILFARSLPFDHAYMEGSISYGRQLPNIRFKNIREPHL